MDQPDHPTTCPICGKPTEPSWKSCPFCGFNFEKVPPKPVSEPVKHISVQPHEKTGQTKKSFPTWGWILIILGGLGCLGGILLILVMTGALLLKPLQGNHNVVSVTAAPVNPQSDIPESAPPEIPGNNGPSFGVVTIIPERESEPVEFVDTWFIQDPSMPTYLTFGYILQNPNQDIALTNIELQAVAYDSTGGILATGNAYVYVILPGEELGLTGTGGMTIPENTTVAKVELKVIDKGQATIFQFMGSPFSFDTITYYSDENYPAATAFLTNSQDVGFSGVMINAIAYDKDGRIVGASSNYNDYYIPAKGSIPVTVDMKVNGTVDSIKMYATFTASMHVFEDPETGLPVMVDYGVSKDEYGTVRYTVLVENPDKDQIYQYMPCRLAFFDDAGKILGVTSTQLDTIFPGERMGISSSMMFSYLPDGYDIHRLEFYPTRPANIYDVNGLIAAGLTANPLSADQVKIFPGDYETKITAMIHNSSDRNVQAKVMAVLYDDKGAIIGGGENYPPVIQGKGEAAVEISIYQAVQPARAEIYTIITGLPN